MSRANYYSMCLGARGNYPGRWPESACDRRSAMRYAPTRAEAGWLRERFADRYQTEHAEAVAVLDAPELLADIYDGRRFTDGEPVTRASGTVARCPLRTN